MKKLWVLLGVSMMSLCAMAAPNTIRFQGRLTDSGGTPIVGNDVQVKFAFYSSASGGNPIWETASPMIVATNEAGLFATDIGPVNAQLFANHDDLYLQVSVYDGASSKPLMPRQKLASVAYSFQADYAVMAGTAALSRNIPDNTVSTPKLQNKAVTEEKILDHSIGTSTLKMNVLDSLVPQGMVAMFARACPEGWVPFKPLTHRFPWGVESSVDVSTGGSSAISGLTTESSGTHHHTVDSHRHGVGSIAPQIGIRNEGYDNTVVMKSGSGVGSYSQQTNNGWWSLAGAWWVRPGATGSNPADVGVRGPKMIGDTDLISPGTTDAPNHSHQVASDGNWLPPYYGMIFCEKE